MSGNRESAWRYDFISEPDVTLLTLLDPWAVGRPTSRFHDRPTPPSSTSRDPTPLQKYTFLTLSTLQPHPLASSNETPLLGPPLFPLNTIVSQLLQVYGDVFAVLTIPVEVRSGRIYNQELNVWNWKTGEHLCVSGNLLSSSQVAKQILDID